MKILAILILLATIVGCAASSSERAYTALRGNKLADAEQLYLQALRDGDEGAWHNLGVIYHRQGQTAKAIEYIKMGARYGDQHAQRALIQLGQPVPPADLRGKKSSSDADAGAAALMLLGGAAAAGARTAPAAGPPVRCETRRMAWGNETVCR